MSTFATAAPGPLRADPSKRVNYTLGLVLGVDEFQQEQLYHRAGRWRHNQWLHGYGTVWGLRVSTPDPADADPEIRVTEGAAVDPCGRDICVPATMCVRLNAWLERHRDVLQRLYGTGPATIPLAVVLCHRECPDDVVPVPGEPCRSQDDAMQPSRTRETFELRLALRDEAPWDSPPGDNPGGLTQFRFSQPEEEAVRAFGRLLDRVRVENDGPGGGREALVAAVRALDVGDGWLPPGSPPGDWFVLDEEEAGAAIREAVRVWATEVRPRVRGAEPVGQGCGCPCPGQDDCCVLLAEVDLPVAPGWRVAGSAFPADEERRPVLLQTRLLQEWLTRAHDGCGCARAEDFVTAAPIALDTVRVWLHHDAPLDLAPGAVTVVVNGGAAVPPGSVTALGGMDNAFDVVLSPGAADGDTVELRLDLAAITGDAGLLDRHGPEVRAYVVFRESGAVLPSLVGDAAGPAGDTTVGRIQRQPVSPSAPTANGQVLTWNSGAGHWEPAAPAAAPVGPAAGDVTGPINNLSVSRLQSGRVATGVAPQAGQHLFFDGNAWRPASAVQAPGGAYQIVAAGHFQIPAETGPATPIGAVYNATRVQVSMPLRGRTLNLLVAFGQGRVPTEGVTYVVKGVASNSRTMTAVPLVFQSVSRDGVLLAASLGANIDLIDRLMVEINRIG